MKDRRSCTILILILIFSSIYVIPLAHASENNTSTSLSLEPKTIKVPYLELDDGYVLILVELNINNVHDLKDYSFDFTYNTSILEINNGGFVQMEQWFYNTVGGYSGSSRRGRLANAFSGSGTPFVYGFRVLRPGLTQINLVNTQLTNVNGSIIPHTVSGVHIEALSFEDWADEEYVELMEQYDSLNSSYSLLQTDYHSLNSTHYSLLLNYTQLQEYYDSLNTSHSLLQIDYASLTSSYAALESEYTAMISTSNNIRNLMYVFMATAIILLATTVYFAKKEKAYVWK